MTITTYSGLVAARKITKQDVKIGAAVPVAVVANAWMSLFQKAVPINGSYSSGSGAVMNRLSTGGPVGLSDPRPGTSSYLAGWGYSFNQDSPGVVMLVDLLAAFGGVDANTTSNQTIGTPALTRYTSGAGVMLTFDVTTALGATPANITVTYTNQAGAAGQTTPAQAMTPSAGVQRLQPATLGPFMQLASGDYGVRSVQSVVFDAAMGAGTLAGCLYYPIAVLPAGGNGSSDYVERWLSNQIDGLSLLPVGTDGYVGCFTVFMLSTGANPGAFNGSIRTVQG